MDRVLNFIFWVCILSLLGLLVLMIIAIVRDVSSETVSLIKNQWHCTASVTTDVPITNFINNVPVTTYFPTDECVQFTRNGH